ncbi:MAG: hypothetical protein ACNA7Y_02845, partial [Gammaproteobacteria bacterium]
MFFNLRKFISHWMPAFVGMTVIAAVFWMNTVQALVFPMPPKGEDMVGEVQYTESLPGDDFSKIGRRYGIGYYQLVQA